MALFPVHANERDAIGLFRAHSNFAGGEGGLVVRVTGEGANDALAKTQNTPRVDYVLGSETAYTAAYGLFGLLDEQLTRPETMLGSFLPANSAPVALGPATHLSSGRVSIWQNAGYFMTDTFAIELTDDSAAGEGYGEPANLVTGSPLLARATDSGSAKRGTLADAASGGTKATRCTFISMVDDVSDLLASRVSPAPTTGMFAQGPKILIYQA